MKKIAITIAGKGRIRLQERQSTTLARRLDTDSPEEGRRDTAMGKGYRLRGIVQGT